MSAHRIILVLIALLVLGGGVGAMALLGDSEPTVTLGEERRSRVAPDPVKTQKSKTPKTKAKKSRKPDPAAIAKNKAESDKKAKAKAAEEAKKKKEVERAKRQAKRKAGVISKKLAAAAMAKSQSGTTEKPTAHTNLPAKVIPGKDRVRANHAMRRRAGRGSPNQSRQGAKPGTKKIDAKAAPSAKVQEVLATILKPGLYTEIYYLGEPAAAILARNQEPTLSGPDYTRVDNYIDFPDRNSFALPYDSDNFIVRWSGFINIPEDMTIYFGLGNDVAGALTIDGQSIIVNDVFAWYVETWAGVELKKGYHRISVEHIEGPSGGDTNRNSACRFMYKKTWGASVQPKVVPAAWFFQPEAISAAAPLIESIKPEIAVLDDNIQIFGENFAVDAAGDTETGNVENALLETNHGVQVFIDGVPAELISLAASKITVKVPPGAGNGDIEVRRRGVPSNRKPLQIDQQWGLVISVWDLSNETLAMPTDRVADYTILDDNPFPLTREKFPQFAGKPIAIRAEGLVALHTIPSLRKTTTYTDNRAPLIELQEPKSGYGLRTEGPGTDSASLAVYLGQNDAFKSVLTSALGGGGMGGGGSGFSYSFSGLYPWAHQDSPMKLPPTTPAQVWETLQIDLVFPIQGETEDAKWVEPSFELLASSLHGEARISHFRPSFIPPAPPIVEVMIERYVDENGAALPIAAPVGGDLLMLVAKEAVEFKGPDEFKLAFWVDGVPTTYQVGVPKLIDEGIDNATRINVVNGTQTELVPVRVKIPDFAGEGKLRARMGIVQSEEIEFDVSNRGLVGFYYDFDEVLRTIPNVTQRTPIVRRIDKHLEFENNAIFQLPFPAERFSSEWYGAIRVPEGGEWTFWVQSDDGFRLKIGDKVVSEFPGLRPPRISTGKITLKAGWHDLHIEFYENDVLENFVMQWIAPGTTQRESIPLKHFSTERTRGVPDKHPAAPIIVEGE